MIIQAQKTNATLCFPKRGPEDGEGAKLGQDEIHVWKLPLRRTDEQFIDFENSLCQDERQRADAFLFPHLRQRFVARRGLQRLILGQYCGVRAKDIKFVYDDHGKPQVSPDHNLINLHFSISHSEDLALLACSRHKPVGIDIENIRAVEDRDDIVSRFFSDIEKQAWQSIKPAERTQAFFKAWTRKEAFVKALGVGLGLDLNQFSVSFEDQDTRLLSWSEESEKKENWMLYLVNPDQNFSAALASSNKNGKICLFQK